MSPHDQNKNGSTGRSPTKFMERPGSKDQPLPDKDWYRKWQEGLSQSKKENPG